MTPHVGLRAYLGAAENLYTGEPYELTEAHLREWSAARRRASPGALPAAGRDRRRGARLSAGGAGYAGAQQVVVEGGDHSLQSFPEHLPLILEFAGLAPL